MNDKIKLLGKQIVLALYPTSREDAFKLYKEGRKQEALSRLRLILPSKDAYDKALVWKKDSVWTLEELYQFIAATGKIPPDEAKKFPTETLYALRFRPLPKINKKLF